MRQLAGNDLRHNFHNILVTIGGKASLWLHQVGVDDLQDTKGLIARIVVFSKGQMKAGL